MGLFPVAGDLILALEDKPAWKPQPTHPQIHVSSQISAILFGKTEKKSLLNFKNTEDGAGAELQFCPRTILPTGVTALPLLLLPPNPPPLVVSAPPLLAKVKPMEFQLKNTGAHSV